MDRHWQLAEEGLVPLCLVAASRLDEAPPWHRRTLGNLTAQMDMEQSHGADGCVASPRQGQMRGKPTAQVDTRSLHGTEGQGPPPWHRQMWASPWHNWMRGIPIAWMDAASPRHGWVWGIPTAQADVEHPYSGDGCVRRTEGFLYTYKPPRHQMTAGTSSPQGTAGQPAHATAPPLPHGCHSPPAQCPRDCSDGSLQLAGNRLSKSLIKSSFIL